MSIPFLSRLSTTVLAGMLGLGLLVGSIYSLLLYRAETRHAKAQVENIAEAVIRPLQGLATKGVDGGNIMKLRNKDALALYENSSLLYLKIDGVSRGSPKTAFSAALPPKPISYEYGAPDQDLQLLKGLAAQTEDRRIDETHWLYIVRKKLPEVRNGGEIVAVFSAGVLKDIIWKTLESVLLSSLLVLILTSVIAIFTGRWISRPIVDISQQIQDTSDSLDLQKKVNVQVRNEVGAMGSAFNGFIGKVRGIISHLEEITSRLTTHAGNMSSIASSTETRVQHQSARTEQAAVAINQVATVVEDVASNAQQAAEAAELAQGEARQGKQVVDKTVEDIRDLAQSVEHSVIVVGKLREESERIGGVLDVIRGISEQTNLLALNAAIEAARAGENGRGFAVVADEVRTLASRTQSSTQEIQEMIHTLQEGVKEVTSAMEIGREKSMASVSQADAAGNSLTSIADAVSTIADLNNHIAVSVQEQARASEEINQSIVQINDLTNQTLEEISRAAQAGAELTEISERLGAEIGVFKI